ncbi:N-acetyl sugar amidotransferase [Campylobacter insulaenigrae]|uniref:N-acetyl sugar amidotransferase n=1 Tax=Campylobacter insulaenigrae NCTC 12927 TaxID=1031564 RepID=A0A0A8H397_9BACT|nr:N-acetyl sugar amidotransferase [Campylobacter insulaenigrae]AJC88155.1 N-acetyl sugar amidotransferase [Campylobacter insulaenigrae NCTC 12927]MCR6591957.1 N-acetyl sugar amidotransferase [Campylobacter insulaenigrae]MCR6593480.1 N-acetyl sugar amidotransferase [Campylobacter insulaenigrae]VEH95061.1 N-acetyl sugar amidotransferase [Campylobacter insulaenigrae]VEJ54937.1 N-acetyl sugar amidotransferase [Campylobacter insulaenigrae]
MKYCDYCVMPDTRPGIKFFKDENDKNICSACVNHKNKEKIDYKARFKELEKLCDKYRHMNGKYEYDCAIAVSGGKDSHFQVHIMKEKLGMNPILFSVEDNFTMTQAGKKNLRNLSEEFKCHIISLKPDIKTQKKVALKTFERYGKPTWFIDRLIYSYPFAMALKFNTPLLVYGENVSYEYGGNDSLETPSAKDIFLNGVASDLDIDEFIDDDISRENLQLFFNPKKDDIAKLDPIYLSYFVKWNSYENYIFAKSRGFCDLNGEWDRTHCAENFDQIDSIGYILHAWMKYPKFGHAMASDYAARFVRYGLLSRQEAIKIVKKKDHLLDNKCIEDFCSFVGISKAKFYTIVQKHYNLDLFYKNEFGEYKLKQELKG